jgi:hypothetical protein
MATRYAFLFLGASLTLSSFGQLVINEVDYDQPGNDGAEFIELKNTGSTAVDMSTIAVMMVNGSSGTGVVYASYFSEDWPMLAPGAYFTLCGDTTAGCDAPPYACEQCRPERSHGCHRIDPPRRQLFCGPLGL